MASVRRREFLSMLAAPVAGLPGATEGNASKAPKTFRVKTGGKFPNSALPVLVYSGVLVEGEGLALRESQSSDFAVVGAYPDGTSPDMNYGEDGERPRSDKNIAALKLPPADPVQGRDGALTRLWRG